MQASKFTFKPYLWQLGCVTFSRTLELSFAVWRDVFLIIYQYDVIEEVCERIYLSNGEFVIIACWS